MSETEKLDILIKHGWSIEFIYMFGIRASCGSTLDAAECLEKAYDKDHRGTASLINAIYDEWYEIQTNAFEFEPLEPTHG